MKSSLLQSINSLPALPSTLIQVNKVYNDMDSSIADMAKAIESDPMIIANLLKAANSPLYGFTREIQTPAQAVSLFGMSMTRSIALSNSIKKLLKVDMQPYGITPERFAEISELQATLMMQWYKQIDRKKADKLYLASFLQETGKILIASDVIKEDETTSFYSELELSNNVGVVEKMYVGVSSAYVTSKVFEHWKFDDDFVEMIQYSDSPSEAREEIQEFAKALQIVKSIVSINKPFSEVSINIGLQLAEDAGYDKDVLQNTIKNIQEKIEN